MYRGPQGHRPAVFFSLFFAWFPAHRGCTWLQPKQHKEFGVRGNNVAVRPLEWLLFVFPLVWANAVVIGTKRLTLIHGARSRCEVFGF
jgi:hypothetical protein